MPNYRRYRVLGGTYFFTVNLLERHPNDLLIRHVVVSVPWCMKPEDAGLFILMHGLFKVLPIVKTKISPN